MRSTQNNCMVYGALEGKQNGKSLTAIQITRQCGELCAIYGGIHSNWCPELAQSEPF